MNAIHLFQRVLLDHPKRILLIQAVFLTSLLLYLSTKPSKRTSLRSTPTTTTTTTPSSPTTHNTRPIMHTFFEKIESGEEDLLTAWEDEWTNAGFHPIILTLNDAKQHPFYTEMEAVVGPLFGDGYNAMCLYRWLAIAMSGGGWMCDYDTFPTNFPMEEGFVLPNEGKLTSFESHTPSLISGTAEEWTRVAKLLVEAIPKVDKQDLKSDMHAFLVLKKEGTHDIIFGDAKENMREGFPYLEPLGYVHPRVVDCKTMAGGRAIHLAHRYTGESYERGVFPLYLVESVDEAVNRRGQAARVLMADWRLQCGGSNAK